MLHLSSSFPLLSSFALLQHKRPLLFLWSSSDCFPRSLHTRDARENNLESTLVVTATATPLLLPPSTDHADRRYLSTRFSTVFLLAALALWIVWSEVMAGPGTRKLPAVPSRINRRPSAGDVREALSQRISSTHFRFAASVCTSWNAPFFFAPGENYFGSWDRAAL